MGCSVWLIAGSYARYTTQPRKTARKSISAATITVRSRTTKAQNSRRRPHRYHPETPPITIRRPRTVICTLGMMCSTLKIQEK